MFEDAEGRVQRWEKHAYVSAGIRIAADTVTILASELTDEGVTSHVEPLRRCWSHLNDAIKDFDEATKAAGAERAKKFAESLP